MKRQTSDDHSQKLSVYTCAYGHMTYEKSSDGTCHAHNWLSATRCGSKQIRRFDTEAMSLSARVTQRSQACPRCRHEITNNKDGYPACACSGHNGS